MEHLTIPKRFQRLAGGFAVGLGVGTVGLSSAILSHPAISESFAGATAMIGLFCVTLGWVCLRQEHLLPQNDDAELIA